MRLPESIQDVEMLEDLLSTPTPWLVDAMRSLPGDLVILGVGGKMGPSLASLAARASREAGSARRIFGVSRFSQAGLEDRLRAAGVETIRGDLLDEAFVRSLPSGPLVVFMTGRKFGSAADMPGTWAMNAWVPTLIAKRYEGSRIAAFSTGNVYPFVPVDGYGASEEVAPAPVGEYGMSALGRERMFEYFSRRDGTPVTILRLNYAVEMRYGVLVDLARRVFEERPIDVSMGHANVIWQGDANAMALASLVDAASPPFVLNIAGPELFRVRDVAEALGDLLAKRPRLEGAEAPSALLNDGRRGHERFALPRVGLDRLIAWTADWIQRSGPTLDRPTHFEVRDGAF